MRRILRVTAAVAVLGCLVAFFSVETGTHSTGTRRLTWFSVGQPWPWYKDQSEHAVRPDGRVGGSGEAGVILKSPAWFVLAGAIVGFVAFRRLQPATSTVTTT